MLNDDKTSVIQIKQADLQTFPLFHAVAAVIDVNAGLVDEARREATRVNEMRPDFVPNVVAELKARSSQPGDRARLIADLGKAGLPASDEVRASTCCRITVRPCLCHVDRRAVSVWGPQRHRCYQMLRAFSVVLL